MRYVTGAPLSESESSGRGARPRILELLLGVLIVAFLVARFRTLGTINVNWDEFYFLSRIHELERGALRSAFQTFHVRLFRWVAGVRGTEVDQVIAARHVMFALGVGSVALTGIVTARIADRAAALIAMLATVTFSFVLRHGDSFRADPMVGFLFMAAAAAILLRPFHRGWLAASAAAMALAMVISVKTLLFAPAIGVLLLVTGWEEPAWGRRLRRLGLYAGVVIASYTFLYLAHAIPLAAPDLEVVRKTASSGQGMWGGSNSNVFRRTVILDRAFWALATIGAVIATLGVTRGTRDARRRGLLVLGLLLPLSSLAFYRNTFPYFYVTFVPALAVAVGLAAGTLAKWASRWADARLVLAVIALPFVVRGADFVRRLGADGVRPQRELLEGVHQIFPEPVPYIDRAGMVASFPKVGPFMSTYVLNSYRRVGTPVMRELVATEQPKLLVANAPGLMLDQPWTSYSLHRLLREDFDFLRDNFVPHWGPVWVAGKTLTLDPRADLEMEIAIGGPYTVESSTDVIIDGARLSPGSVITLEPGRHTARSVNLATMATLRFGNHLRRPLHAPPAGALFWGL